MRHRTRHARLMAVVILLFVIALLCALYAGGRYLEKQNERPETRSAYKPLHQTGNVIEVNGERYTQRGKITTILLMGIDHPSGTQPSGYRNGGQADFLRLIVIDDEMKRVSQLAIDRDTMTPITVLGVLGNRAGTRVAQISLSHGFGDGREQSCELTKDAVSKLLLNTKIDFYLAMSMDGITALNDAVGGVTVTLEDDFSAQDPAMTRGTTFTLMGKQAEIYVRSRMSVGSGTNAERMARQQQYINQLIRLVDERAHENREYIGELFDALKPYLITNLSRGRMINEAWASRDYARQPLHTPGGQHVVDADGFMAFYVDEAELQQMTLELFYTLDESP